MVWEVKWKIRGRVLELARTRGTSEVVTGTDDGEGFTESVDCKRIITHSERASAKWAAVASQARKRDGKGEWAYLPGPQRGQTRAYL